MQPGEPSLNNVSRQVEDLAALPEGFRFDQAAVWSQLESRLQPARKRSPLRWIAAAAVLLGICLSGWYYISRTGLVAPAAATPNDVKEGTVQHSVATPFIAVSPKAPFTKHTSRKIQLSKVKEPKVATLINEPIVSQEVASVTTSPAETAVTAPAQETVTTSAPQPRFRIVHSNELRMPLVPVEVLQQKEKNSYGLLWRTAPSASATEAPMPEEPPVKKHPKTLMGLFNSN